MKVKDLAEITFIEIGSPSILSVTNIAYYYRANVGQLNNAINTSYYVNSDLEIVQTNENDSTQTDELGEEEASIFKAIYKVHYYDIEIRRNILSYSSSSVIEVSSDGNRVRVASPTEIGRNLYVFRKNEGDELSKMIARYKMRQSSPRQVAGDDTVEGIYDYDYLARI